MSENNSPGHSSEQAYQWPVGRENYQIGNCIGHGATSEVFQSNCLPLKKPCAIKMINLEKCRTSASLEEINKEIKSMKNLRNENIVTYYASFIENIDLYIVMDLCQRGSLLDVIKDIQKKRDITYGVFNENTIATILKDVLHGLAYIHSNDLVHRDLKCGNLLLRNDGVIQIADFGVAGFLASQSTFANTTDAKRFTFVGTPCWMAPEVMQQVKGYNQRADIWSLGISTIEMATGQAPYARFVPMKVLMLTMKNDPPDIDTVATVSNQYINYGMKYRKFCRACLMKDPDQRLSAKDLQIHSFIRNKAKDRDFLQKTLLNDDFEPKPVRAPKSNDDSGNREDNKTGSSDWVFDSDDTSDDEENSNQRTTNHSGSQSRQNLKLFAEDENFPQDSSETVRKNPSNQKPTPVTPSPKSIVPEFSDAQEITNPAADPANSIVATTASVTAFRITLRKRNLKQNNELQDISFSFIMNKDHPDLLARELVEEGLLDGCDLVLVSHHMKELIENPTRKSVVFPLNSPTAPGQMPLEEELHGYAKVIIRPLTPDAIIQP